MKHRVLIIGGHGMGDCMLAFQCAQALAIKRPSFEIKVGLSTRPEIYSAICSLISNSNNLPIKLDENLSSNHKIEDNWEKETITIQNDHGAFDKIYYVIPDLLFRNPHSFDYLKYGIHPQIIKQQRVLLQESSPEQKRVYCGLQTTTPGYLYAYIPSLIEHLSKALPDYEIYFPNITKWNNDKAFELVGKFNSNVFIDNNPTLEQSLTKLRFSQYFIGTCNGPSHIAYHLGIPRTILDPQYDRPAWVARWKEDYLECINITLPPYYITRIVSDNIQHVESTLMPRNMSLINNSQVRPWKETLFFKY